MKRTKWMANGKSALLTIACVTAFAAEPRNDAAPGALTAPVSERSVHVFVAGSGVSQSVLINATTMAGSMFEAIGVQVVWDHRQERPSADGIYTRIEISNSTARENHPGALAFAYPYAGTKAITVFYDRIRDVTDHTARMEQRVLAHVLVHEISHVLQGIGRHSDRGVMKARWEQKEYNEIQWKALSFTPTDVQLIRIRLASLQMANADRAE